MQWEAIVLHETKSQWGTREPIQSGKIELDMAFFVLPDLKKDNHPHGPDLDNLLKPIVDGIAKTIFCKSSKNPKEHADYLIYRINATKVISEDEGVEIIVKLL